MIQLPTYSRHFSVYLSRVLDEAGLNERTVTRRRRLHLQMETRSNIVHLGLEGKNRTNFNFGSQTEGTTTPGLNSDMDFLYCLHDFHVIQDWGEWKQGRASLMLLSEDDVAPGYCRLQLVAPEAPVAATEIPSVRGMVFDKYSRVLVVNSIIHDKMMANPDMKFFRSGPASTRTDMDGRLDDDTVVAFRSDSWSSGSLGWVGKNRLGHWPTSDMVQFCVESGCFLVPVGHRLSGDANLEWRISPSLSERCLMFSMNITQLKTYVTVKLLMKTFVTPKVGKTISSFHCKTAMFYCIENTEPELWQKENLLKCVTLCLFVLLHWVSNGYCPQYFNPDENLFAGKIKPDVHEQLIGILKRLINSKGGCLLKVQYDDLGKRLTEKFTTLPSTETFNSYWTLGLFGDFVMRGKYNAAMTLRYVIKHVIGLSTQEAMVVVRKFIRTLQKYRKEQEQSEGAVRELLPYMYTLLGSLVAAHLLNSGEKRVPLEVIQLFQWGNQSDLSSSRLKLAAVLYSAGQPEKAATILGTVEKRLARRTFLPACGCRGTPHSPKPTIVFKWLEAALDYQDRSLIAHCVIFSPQEMSCIPQGLGMEMYRAFGNDEQRRKRADVWMNWAVADSLPFLHYMQYLTYDKLGDQTLKQRSLEKLMGSVNGGQDLCHKETALNLIGQCLETEGSVDAARQYYNMSLKVFPRNNAAHWHLTNLGSRPGGADGAQAAEARNTIGQGNVMDACKTS